MTTTSKSIHSKDSNYIALEVPIRKLEEAIENYKLGKEIHSSFERIETAFVTIKSIVFTKDQIN